MQASRFATPLSCIGPLHHSRVQKPCWLAPCDFFPIPPTPTPLRVIFPKLRTMAAMRALPLLGIARKAPTGRTGQGGSQMPPAPATSLPPPQHTYTHTHTCIHIPGSFEGTQFLPFGGTAKVDAVSTNFRCFIQNLPFDTNFLGFPSKCDRVGLHPCPQDGGV